MKIAIFNSTGVGLGGAVRAARRLVAGLRQRGHEVSLVSQSSRQAVDGIGIQPAEPHNPAQHLALTAHDSLQHGYIDRRRTALSNTLYSAEVAGYDFQGSALLDQIDIINIHWVAGFLAPHTITGLMQSGLPVIFTLHDMATFTGGCHYSAGCNGYRTLCTPCPQLTDDPLRLSAWTLAGKRALWGEHRPAAIAPSRWLASCAAASGLFAADRVFTIANGIETDIFRPTAKAAAKSSLGIGADVKTLIFGAENNSEHRKGFDLLLKTLEHLRTDPRVATLIAAGRLCVLVFGQSTPELRATGIAIHDLGTVDDDIRLAQVYSAGDVLLLPSREDNLPNIMVEAMACATPIVAFAVGGVPDVIEDGRNGRWVSPSDAAAMAATVAELLQDEAGALAMGRAARDRITAVCSLDAQAQAYETLFEQLRGKSKPVTRTPSTGPASRTITLPMTLQPELESTAIGLFLEQQACIEGLRHTAAAADQQARRVHEILSVAADEIVASKSWRLTRPLRQFTGVSVDPKITADTALDDAAVTLLQLYRSKSWELSAPLRISRRLLNAVLRSRTNAAVAQTHGEVEGSTPGVRRIMLDGQPAPKTLDRKPAILGRMKLFGQRRGCPKLRPNIICLHLYHLDLWDEFREVLYPVVDRDRLLYVSLPETRAAFAATIRRSFPDEVCRISLVENRGLDVYPFLLQYQEILEQGIEPLTLTKLHTKRSTHHDAEYAQWWRTDLYQRLCEHHPRITDEFLDGGLGMVCSGNWWVREPQDHPHFMIERDAINRACWVFDVVPTYEYLTGSMYVLSFDYMKKLLARIDLRQAADLFEPGYRPSGTLAHGFERVVCYALRKYGYELALV